MANFTAADMRNEVAFLGNNISLLRANDRSFADSLIKDAKSRGLTAAQFHWVKRLNARATGTETTFKKQPKFFKAGDKERVTWQGDVVSSPAKSDPVPAPVPAPAAAPSSSSMTSAQPSSSMTSAQREQFKSEITIEIMKNVSKNIKFSATPAFIEEIAGSVTDKVAERLDSRVPRRIEVTRDGHSRLIEGRQHPQFEKLLRAATCRVGDFVPGIFLQGEASSGKTTGCRMLAKALDLPWHFNGAISMPHEMLGFIDAGGTYHRTPFREAYENGGVYTFDEVDRSDPVALLAVNPHLANGVATFPDKQVIRHPDCIIVATANTWGLGADAQYAGATRLDGAFLSRFPVRISWDIDESLECHLVGNDAWLRRVRRARTNARASGVKVMICTRLAMAGAALIAAGVSEDDAAAQTYLANLKAEQKQIVER